MHSIPPPTHKERGQSLMEFALVLPILLIVFMGIFDFGRLLFLYSQVMNGAREGARYGSVFGVDSLNPHFRRCAEIRDVVQQGFGLPLEPDNIAIEYDDGDELHPFTCDTLTSENESSLRTNQGHRIRVTVTAEYEFITPGMSTLFPDMTLTFTSARTLLLGGTRVPPGST